MKFRSRYLHRTSARAARAGRLPAMAETKRTLLERLAAGLARVEPLLNRLEGLGVQILTGVTMANQALETLITQLNEATNLIAARIERLTTSLQDVATPEQLAELSALQAQLTALGQDPTNPVPIPTPEPAPEPAPAAG